MLLSTGADDYVTKPFAVRELVARVRAIMRRTSVPTGQRQDELNYDSLKIPLPSRRVAIARARRWLGETPDGLS